MHTAWIKNLKGLDKSARKDQVLSYKNAFDDLLQILDGFQKKEADRDYSPGWEHRQIAVNEYNAALDDLRKLIDLKPKDH